MSQYTYIYNMSQYTYIYNMPQYTYIYDMSQYTYIYNMSQYTYISPLVLICYVTMTRKIYNNFLYFFQFNNANYKRQNFEQSNDDCFLKTKLLRVIDFE